MRKRKHIYSSSSISQKLKLKNILWTEEETNIFITCFKRRKDELVSSGRSAQAFTHLLQDMLEQGFRNKLTTSIGLKIRFYSLVRAYKAVQNKKANVRMTNFVRPYMELMESIFGKSSDDIITIKDESSDSNHEFIEIDETDELATVSVPTQSIQITNHPPHQFSICPPPLVRTLQLPLSQNDFTNSTASVPTQSLQITNHSPHQLSTCPVPLVRTLQLPLSQKDLTNLTVSAPTESLHSTNHPPHQLSICPVPLVRTLQLPLSQKNLTNSTVSIPTQSVQITNHPPHQLSELVPTLAQLPLPQEYLTNDDINTNNNKTEMIILEEDTAEIRNECLEPDETEIYAALPVPTQAKSATEPPYELSLCPTPAKLPKNQTELIEDNLDKNSNNKINQSIILDTSKKNTLEIPNECLESDISQTSVLANSVPTSEPSKQDPSTPPRSITSSPKPFRNKITAMHDYMLAKLELKWMAQKEKALHREEKSKQLAELVKCKKRQLELEEQKIFLLQKLLQQRK